MNRTIPLLLLLFVGLFETQAFAHGEDKAGPNGGFIRMPGAFHTELVPINKYQFKLFLLDVQWKNPSVLESSVKVKYSGKNNATAKCSIEGNHYLCSLPKDVDLTQKGQLLVEAQREKQRGIAVHYELPPTLSKAEQHGNHE